MTESKVEIRGEKLKEKFEEKAKDKQEDVAATEGEAPKKEASPKKKKVDVKKPVVSETKGVGNFLAISFKQSVEIARALKGMDVKKALAYITDVIKLIRPVRYVRYTRDVPHRKGAGFGPGRFPVVAIKQFEVVLKNAVANAKYLNLDENDLYIKGAKASRAVAKQRGGRHTNIEIVVAEKRNRDALKETRKTSAKEVKPHTEPVKPHVESVKPHVEQAKPHVEPVKPHVEAKKSTEPKKIKTVTN